MMRNIVLSDAILKMVKEKEREFKEKFTPIIDIQEDVAKFINKTGFSPEEIRMNIKVYEYLVNAASFNQCRVVTPCKIMGLDIVIDDSLENFEVLGYRDFMGIKRVIK